MAVAILAAVGLTLLAIGGCGGADRRPVASAAVHHVGVADGHPADAGSGAGRRPGAVGGAPRPAVRPVSPAAIARLRATLETAVGGLGPDVGIAVEDLSTGQRLVDDAGSVAHPPASVQKLYTSAAMLWLLGPQGRLHTELLGSGSLGAHGVWNGDLYLVGDGDPTFGDGAWNAVYDKGQGPTVTELLADLTADGIRRVNGLLYADPYRFDGVPGGFETGGAPDLPDYMGQMSALVYDHGLTLPGLTPATTAVREIALAARAAHLHLSASTRVAAAPADAQLLANLASPRLPVMLGLMNGPSDDLFADLFAKQLGYHFNGTGTLASGASVIAATIAQHYGIHPIIHDGSGLDHADRSTPDGVLTMLAEMHGTPVGELVRDSMPVVGRTGTVAPIGVHTPAAGRCRAKTGTLNSVANLAGYCQTASGHLLAFVFFVDGPPNTVGKAAFTPMVSALASY